DSFVETAIVKDALSVQIPLVLGRKGSGKTAIFRKISEDTEQYNSVVVHAPAPLQRGKGWIITVDGFQYIEKIINDSELSWRHFWVLYVNTSIINSLDLDVDMPEYLQEVPLQSEREIIAALKKTAEIPGVSLELNDWLLRLDRKAARNTFLLLDGLDTGFGSAPLDRKRRSGAIEGLFDLLMNQGQTLQYFHFKILLREDIWRKLHFENKSHLYGRGVELKWTEQATFLKVILKQALRCKPFREFLQKKSDLPDPEKRSVDSWTEKDVLAVWNILVGERMQGGRTAFTRNWVWTRLADSNNDHTPRYLLQLFHEAVPWEQKENNRSRYPRALMRPRALIKCLPEVSVQALEALKEESKELEP
ncbi:MAG: ParA family protein, partial [Candidatus Electrothrix sp. AR1]|nr:ParA family protein [Candidatus Electrothrix sp. AR1]